MKKLIILIFSVVLLSSCATHSGYIASSASLSKANFSYKKQISGTSKATYVFGLGGFSKQSLIDEAKRNMLAENPLKENQALANVSVSWKKSSYTIFVIINKCIVTADIVEFNDNGMKE
jgi:hypothetical protein